MDKLLLLKGKLEMAKRTIQLQKASSGKKANALLQQKPEPLVYKDGDAGDSSDEGAGSDGNDEDMEDEDNSSSEEEIKEIPLRQLA